MRGKSLPDRGDGLGTCPRAVHADRVQSTTAYAQGWGLTQDQARVGRGWESLRSAVGKS